MPEFLPQDNQVPLQISSGGVNEYSLIAGYVVPWNKIYLRKFLVNNGITFDSLICAEDRSFYYEVIFKAERIVRVQDRFVIHRINIPSSLDGSDIRLRHFYVEFRSFEHIWNTVRNAPESTKKLVLEKCISDSMFYYARSLGTEFERTIRNQLHDYWPPFITRLGKDIRKKKWYVLYIGVIAGDLPGPCGRFIEFLCRHYNRAAERSGWQSTFMRRVYKAITLLVLFLLWPMLGSVI